MAARLTLALLCLGAARAFVTFSMLVPANRTACFKDFYPEKESIAVHFKLQEFPKEHLNEETQSFLVAHPLQSLVYHRFYDAKLAVIGELHAADSDVFTHTTVGREIISGVVWNVVRWPLGLLTILLAVTLLLSTCPRRHQPHLSWMAFGAMVATGLWAFVTVGLGLFFRMSQSFGRTYGPLAGVVALLLGSLFSAIALFYGAAMIGAVTVHVASQSFGPTAEPSTTPALANPVCGGSAGSGGA